ncbi:MAG: hypothetical protein LBK23_11700 [Oscillospiraceae bacterium]|jgi:hypothetical protein|nr:hypothetical protein [Oscillospiraceae bacterium]
MKIPETIRINGIDFAIEQTQNLNDGDHVLYGQVHYGHSTIEINAQYQKHQAMCVTLWHEILHALCKIHSVHLGEHEEAIVDILAYGIYQVLQDNGRELFDIAD